MQRLKNYVIAHGADKVYVLDVTGLSVPRADIYGHILAEAVLKHKPMLVLFALTDFGRELASRTASLSKRRSVGGLFGFEDRKR